MLPVLEQMRVIHAVRLLIHVNGPMIVRAVLLQPGSDKKHDCMIYGRSPLISECNNWLSSS